MTAARLPAPWGTRVDRSTRLSFEFNGRMLSGHPGDTLASALLANGVQLVGRSVKLHRPGGIFSCGVEEPTGLVDLGVGAARTPNMRATLVELYDGLVASSVNCWPSVDFDLGAINNQIAALLPAGFYYKTFKWPNWHLFEPAIRRMAGLGRASGQPDPDRYEEAAARADVLVVGGGLAGLSAAVSAAEAGADTLLLAGGATLGGALAWRGDVQVAELIARAKRAGVRQMTQTLAFGIYDHNLVCARETLQPAAARAAAGGVLRERLWKICAPPLISPAGGHAPAVHLHAQAGGKLRWLEESAMFVPDGAAPGVWSAGAGAGIFDRDTAVSHAAELGLALALGRAVPPAAVGGAGRTLAVTHLAGVAGKQFVDLQNDVSVGDVGLAAQENYRSVEHLKRYTTTGMGTDQGKTSNINALVLMGEFTGREPAEVGTTKFRPPFAPVTLGLLAGRRVGSLYRPLKTLPAHSWHQPRRALYDQFSN